jgi:hypothetical protein
MIDTVTTHLHAARVLVARLSMAIDDLANALIDADALGGDEDTHCEHARDAHDYLTDVLASLERAVKQAAV